MERVLLAKNLSLAYGKNVVISGATFEIFDGDFVCVVGANGSGKSTLIRALLGLSKPAAGKILYGDEMLKTSIGYLPQETKVEQDFPATVFEIVLSGALGRFGKRLFYRAEDKAKAEECLKELGILKLKGRGFGELSGGQKQKALLARALMATSKLLVLDEPSNNLDFKSRKEFYGILKELKKGGLSIIMITHDLDADDLIGNKVLAIKDGKVTLENVDDYLRSFK